MTVKPSVRGYSELMGRCPNLPFQQLPKLHAERLLNGEERYG